MAVEFRPHDISYRGMSQYQDGQRIPCARFKTEVLPLGTPTERFRPYRAANGLSYLIDVAVEVQHHSIILYALRAGQTVDPNVHGYPLSHSRFPQGLPVTVTQEGREFAGLLRPLPAPAARPA